MNASNSAVNQSNPDFGKILVEQEIAFASQVIMFPFGRKISQEDQEQIKTVLDNWKKTPNPTMESLVMDFVGVSKKCLSASWCAYFNTFKVLLIMYRRALENDYLSTDSAQKCKLGVSLYECLRQEFAKSL